MNEIRIVFLDKSDWENFSHLFKTQLLTDFSTFPQAGKKFFLEKKYRGLESSENFLAKKKAILAKDKEKIVGFLISHQVPGGVNVCDWLWVDKSFREQGVGRSLVKFWEENSLKEKKTHRLNVSTSNKDNLAFYQKLGFKLEGVRKKDQWKADRYLLGKLIKVSEKIKDGK